MTNQAPSRRNRFEIACRRADRAVRQVLKGNQVTELGTGSLSTVAESDAARRRRARLNRRVRTSRSR